MADSILPLAHSLAYTNHRLLHRDISAGNVIIRPSLSADVDENGNKEVIWEGVLTDWELAKEIPVRDPSDPEAPKEVPRQPERTGTWQFMSVHYVRDHPKCPVSVADELESFFHVLLFYAVRLLHHNITNVPSFVAEYFDSYAVTGQIKRSCSAKKSTAMDDGVIRVTSQGVPLQFKFADGNPHSDFNDLIGDLLQYFKARYEVLAWESRKPQKKPDPAVPSLSNAPAASAPPKPGPNKKRRRQLVNLAQVGVQSVRQEKGEPSDDTKARAKHLDDHSVFLATLGNAIDPERSRPDRAPVWPVWPETDVVEDRLPDKYDPRILASMFNEMYTASGLAATEEDPAGAPARKKLRTDISEPSKPPRPRKSTRARTVGGSSVGGATGSGKGKARALD
ncbi:hypothetical protein NUW54_g4647 [Trametes sanguinea]|uniref:Uncharacterized protein n=2 Tax=Trametes sanguinea TaxID=158606 RepID=A0ACC1Q051_9APHY|nr:hypothetical protein NUW54_g4647 [Trametes sanguinea]